MSTKKKDKKSNSGNGGEAKSEKGSATGKSWEIFRAEIIRETAKTFQVAKVLMEQFDGLEVTPESMDDVSASLDLNPGTLLWHRAMYETYVGASHVLDSDLTSNTFLGFLSLFWPPFYPTCVVPIT